MEISFVSHKKGTDEHEIHLFRTIKFVRMTLALLVLLLLDGVQSRHFHTLEMCCDGLLLNTACQSHKQDHLR